jgi:hypothetical protein
MPRINEEHFFNGFVGFNANAAISDHIDICDRLLEDGNFVVPRIGVPGVPEIEPPDLRKDLLAELEEAIVSKENASGHRARAGLLAISLEHHCSRRNIETVHALTWGNEPNYDYFMAGIGYGEMIVAGLKHARYSGDDWHQADSLDYCVRVTEQTIGRVGLRRTSKLADKLLELGRRWGAPQLDAHTP